jgi:hypothetical protein
MSNKNNKASLISVSPEHKELVGNGVSPPKIYQRQQLSYTIASWSGLDSQNSWRILGSDDRD